MSLETSNGVWSSATGVEWMPESAAPGWLSRGLHAAVVFQDKLWVLGGAEELTELNDVWSSTDGVAWTEETESAPWSPRGGHTVLVFEDELWLLGGGAGRDDEFQVMNDVWTSADGVNWTEASVSVPWSVRGGHTAVVYQDRLWVLGGASYQGKDGKALADAWSYAEGEWREEEDVTWPARGGHTSVVFARGSLWVMGGVQGEGDLLMGADFAETRSDVWSETARPPDARLRRTPGMQGDAVERFLTMTEAVAWRGIRSMPSTSDHFHSGLEAARKRSSLPPLTTMGTGSFAAPGWFGVLRRMIRRGELGPEDEIEVLRDATRAVVQDQIDCGVDVLTDGEVSRQRFVFELFDCLDGLRRQTPRRRLGVGGYDSVPRLCYEGTLACKSPKGLGTLDEFARLREFSPHWNPQWRKMSLPGPLTFAAFIETSAERREKLFVTLLDLLKAECAALVRAGVCYLQIDEPAFPVPPHGLSLMEAAARINELLDALPLAPDGMPPRTAVHVCFGNNAGRPYASRRLSPLSEAMRTLHCDQLMLEFANREMAEVRLAGELAESFDIVAGVVDVKNFALESTDEVRWRIDRCLEHIPERQLHLTADCGFSALPRYLAREKLRVLVEAAQSYRDPAGRVPQKETS